MLGKETGLLKGAAITAADIPINECHFQNSKYSNAYNSVPLYLNLVSFLLEVSAKYTALKRSRLQPSRFHICSYNYQKRLACFSFLVKNYISHYGQLRQKIIKLYTTNLS